MSKYIDIGTEIGTLVSAKNEAYGDSFSRSGEILSILYPSGVRPDQYGDMLGVVRVIDKLFRIAKGEQMGESPWRDIAGYGILGVAAADVEIPAPPLVPREIKDTVPSAPSNLFEITKIQEGRADVTTLYESAPEAYKVFWSPWEYFPKGTKLTMSRNGNIIESRVL